MHRMQHHEQLIFITTIFCINKQFIIINLIEESSFFCIYIEILSIDIKIYNSYKGAQ